MDIVLATTIWKRPLITEAVLTHYNSLEVEGIDFTRIAVTSNGADADLARRLGWKVHPHPNEPLNEKHNAMALHAGLEDPDAVCFFNSDDLISEDYFARTAWILEESPGTHASRLMNYTMIDLGRHTPLDGRFSAAALPGSGFLFTMEGLESLSFAPWQGEAINSHLDTRLVENVADAGLNVAECVNSHNTDIQICALKTERNIWSYKEHLRAVAHHWEEMDITFGAQSRDVDPLPYLEQHFPDALRFLESTGYFEKFEKYEKSETTGDA